MRTLILLCFVGHLIACANDGSSARGCPDPAEDFVDDCRTAVDIGDSCSFDAKGSALAGECQCDASGFWVCNSCPFYWTPLAPADPCTPNATCEINSWEHGCSCSCNAAGEWSCSPDTINSRCPQ